MTLPEDPSDVGALLPGLIWQAIRDEVAVDELVYDQGILTINCYSLARNITP